jgi:hypothetical protein
MVLLQKNGGTGQKLILVGKSMCVINLGFELTRLEGSIGEGAETWQTRWFVVPYLSLNTPCAD